jgi:two-component system, chemotaxis family, chemotaxis protein CheY
MSTTAATVLVIDDSPTVRTLARSSLERAGFSVIDACDGAEAMARLDGQPIGVIVCDLSMPRMDGMGFLQHVRSHPRYKFTPLAVLSTDTRTEVRNSTRAAGAQAFITKPCTPATLVDAVRRLCVGAPQ